MCGHLIAAVQHMKDLGYSWDANAHKWSISAQQSAQGLNTFLVLMKARHPLFPLKHWIQDDGKVCWASAGTEHMWNGWLLAWSLE